MRPAWAVFRRLVFARPGVFAMLLLFYVAAGFMTLFLTGRDDIQVWVGLVAVCVIPTGGILALATERMVQLCTSAGEIAIPGHAQSVRRAQALLLAWFAVLPVVTLSVLAGQFSFLFVLAMLVVGALGTSIVTQPYVGFAVIVVFILAGKTEWLWSLFAHPAFQGAALLGALYLYYRWFQFPARIEAAADQRVVKLADATHETTDIDLHPTFEIGEQELEARVAIAKQEIAVRPDAAALAVGLGFEILTPWKKLLRGIAVGAIAIIVWHFIHGRRPEWMSLLVLTIFIGLALMGRITSIVTAWTSSADEQSLLRLTAAWPSEAHVKRAFLRAVIRCQAGGWTSWITLTTLAFVIGSVSIEHVLIGAVALLAVVSGTAASFGFLLARSALKKEHVTTIVSVLSAFVGAIAFAMSSSLQRPGAAAMAVVLVLLPPLIALAVVSARPLLFPVVQAKKR